MYDLYCERLIWVQSFQLQIFETCDNTTHTLGIQEPDGNVIQVL